MTRRTAFTLIELLIVVFLVAALAAILFPVLAQARERSRQSVCQSNAHQVWMSLRMYADDYDSTWPTSRAWQDWHKSYPSIPGCPSASINENREISGVNGYGLNAGLTERVIPNPQKSNLPPSIFGVADAAVVSPATTVCLCDNEPGKPFQSGFYPAEEKAEGAWVRHQGGANYSFVDGHTKWYRPEAVIPGSAGLPLRDGYLVGNDGQFPTFNVDPPIRIQ